MIIKGHKVTIKELFTNDKSNHNTLIGGFMGFAHAALSLLVMGLAWLLAYPLHNLFLGSGLMMIAWFFSNLHWYRKETKSFTVSLFKPRSTPLVTLDTRLDFFNPLFFSTLVVLGWFASWVV
jgi:hypothetical protein